MTCAADNGGCPFRSPCGGLHRCTIASVRVHECHSARVWIQTHLPTGIVASCASQASDIPLHANCLRRNWPRPTAATTIDDTPSAWAECIAKHIDCLTARSTKFGGTS